MKQILIECGKTWFEFTKSVTGQLDFAGKVEVNAKTELKGWQKIASSAYFSPAKYVYLADAMNMTPYLYIAEGVDISDSDVYDYLLHVGALLAAVDSKDSLLAGELYLRRRKTFEKFAQLSQYIMKDLCVEILFSLCYGRMQNVSPEELPLVYNSVLEKLNYNPADMNLEQALMRYAKDNDLTLTLPLVGTCFYNWDSSPLVLDNLCDNLSVENLLTYAEKIRKAKHEFYSSLEVAVQAEPYNPHDVNAVLVSIEDIEAKISGNPGLSKVGHLRALAAKFLRNAKPKKMAYEAELAAIGDEEIIVKIRF